MISSNDFRPGVTIEIDGNVWQVIEFQHVKPGKGAAFVRSKLRNLQTGSVIERTFNAGVKFPAAQVERKTMQYLYESDGSYYFMDVETYDQIMLTKEQLGEKLNFLKAEMEVIETEPGIRGNTATGASKPAKVETGYIVRVPLFVNEGDVLRIDTRSGEYLERAK